VRNGFSGPTDDLPPEVALTNGLVRGGPRTLGGSVDPLDGATVAFRALALARLERDHAALLAALCELESGRNAAGRANTATVAPRGRAEHAEPVSPNSPALRDALAVLLRDDLRQTQRALGRAASGEYGQCDTCHVEIDLRTLLVQPEVTRCAHCVAAAERARQVH
jgi:RNA polymerase-binding transcription factor DksA